MKYLVKFNESLLSEEDLKDFCESNLAYLMDDGFTIKIYRGGHSYSSLLEGQFSIWLQNNNAKELFDWNMVKDIYIPFLQKIKSRWDIIDFSRDVNSTPSVRFRMHQKKENSFFTINKDFSYSNVINDNIFAQEGYWKAGQFHKWVPDPKLLGIGIVIKNKKID